MEESGVFSVEMSFSETLGTAKGLSFTTARLPRADGLWGQGNKLWFRHCKCGEVLSLRGFCSVRDDPQIFVFFARQEKTVLCCLWGKPVHPSGDPGEKGSCVGDMDLLLLPFTLIFLSLKVKEDLAPRNAHVETTAGCSLCCPICTSPSLLLLNYFLPFGSCICRDFRTELNLGSGCHTRWGQGPLLFLSCPCASIAILFAAFDHFEFSLLPWQSWEQRRIWNKVGNTPWSNMCIMCILSSFPAACWNLSQLLVHLLSHGSAFVF